MEYLIEIPSSKVEAAQNALQELGITFTPKKDAAIVDEETTGFGEVILGSDAGMIAETINAYLKQNGLTPHMIQGELTLEQTLAAMEIAKDLFIWESFGIQDIRFEETQDGWRAAAADYPALFSAADQQPATIIAHDMCSQQAGLVIRGKGTCTSAFIVPPIPSG